MGAMGRAFASNSKGPGFVDCEENILQNLSDTT